MVLAAEVLLGALILALTGALVVGRSGGLEDESADAPPFTLPPGRLSVAELRALRLPMAVRGYRMAEVDALLGRLTDQLDDGGRAAAPEPGGAPVDPPGHAECRHRPGARDSCSGWPWWRRRRQPWPGP